MTEIDGENMPSRTLRRGRRPELQANRKTKPSREAQQLENKDDAARWSVAKLPSKRQLVVVQKDAIRHFQQSGLPTELAEKMLELMERTLATFRADLGRLGN